MTMTPAAIADAFRAASLTDKLTHDCIVATCPAVFHRIDSDWQTHNLTTERRNGKPDYNAPSSVTLDRGNTREDRNAARLEVIFAAVEMQSAIDTPDDYTDPDLGEWLPAVEPVAPAAEDTPDLAARIDTLNAQIESDLAGTRARLAAFDAKQAEWKAARNAAIEKHETRSDYMNLAVAMVTGIVIGLAVACIAASAVLSNLPQ